MSLSASRSESLTLNLRDCAHAIRSRDHAGDVTATGGDRSVARIDHYSVRVWSAIPCRRMGGGPA
jgi:hypothetical protein